MILSVSNMYLAKLWMCLSRKNIRCSGRDIIELSICLFVYFIIFCSFASERIPIKSLIVLLLISRLSRLSETSDWTFNP